LARGEGQRQGIHPAVATAAALASVVGAVIAVLAFVVGIFDDENGSTKAVSTASTSDPVIESLVNVPPASIDAAGVSGPVSEGKAIYLVARQPKNGDLVASTTARVSKAGESGEQLHWRALLDLGKTSLGSTLGSEGGGSAPYEVVAAVLPKVRSTSGSSPYATDYSTGASADAPDLDAAEAVSSPRLVQVP
jgi:hypothetical protein